MNESFSSTASNLPGEIEVAPHLPPQMRQDQDISWADVAQRQDQDFTLLGSDIDSFLNYPEEPTLDLPTPDTSTPQPSSTSNSSSRALSNPEFELLDFTSFGTSVLDTTLDSVPLPSIDRLNDLPAQSKHCLLACTHLIDHLDAKLQEDSLSLDKIMCICRESIQKLARIRSAYESLNSASCPPLMLTAMNQIVTLLEKGTQPEVSRIGAIDAKARVTYGTFEVDNEDQNVLGSHIVRSELKRALETVSTLHDVLQRQEERRRDWRIYRQWSGDLTRRLEISTQWFPAR